MNERCAACGMTVADNEYHPNAACVMYGASRDAGMVRANLAAVAEKGARAQKEADAARVKAAGCPCAALYLAYVEQPGVMEWTGTYDFAGRRGQGMVGKLLEHDHRCPASLAAAILEGKP